MIRVLSVVLLIVFPLSAFAQEAIVQLLNRANSHSEYRSRKASGTICYTDESKSYVLSCAHFLQPKVNELVVRINGKEIKGKLRGLNTKSDLSVIEIPPQKYFIPVSDRISYPSDVSICGYNGKDFFECRRGRLTGEVSSERGRLLNINGACYSGNSGGPILNETGEIVGVITRGIADKVTRSPLLGETRTFLAECCPGIFKRRMIVPPPPRNQYPIKNPIPVTIPQPLPTGVDYERIVAEVITRIPKAKDGIDGIRGPPGEKGNSGNSLDIGEVIKELQPFIRNLVKSEVSQIKIEIRNEVLSELQGQIDQINSDILRLANRQITLNVLDSQGKVLSTSTGKSVLRLQWNPKK